MTESEWLACADPRAMLDHLRDAGLGSDRKLRLFACACCRGIWHLLADGRSREVVEAAERFADGLVTREELRAARAAALVAARRATRRATRTAWRAAWAVLDVASDSASDSASDTAWAVALAAEWDAELTAQAGLVREVFGNPFRAVAFRPGWRTPDVRRLAESAYQDRDWGALPVLADALEDAECQERVMVDHLRSAGPHVRGCWALDLAAGRG